MKLENDPMKKNLNLLIYTRTFSSVGPSSGSATAIPVPPMRATAAQHAIGQQGKADGVVERGPTVDTPLQFARKGVRPDALLAVT